MKKAAKSNQVGKSKGKKSKKDMAPEGAEAKQNLGKFARGGSAKHKTQVNVIVGGGNKQPMPVPVPAGGPPPGAPPAPPPQMPPGGAPPMGMPTRPGMKRGGKVPQFKGGAGGGLGRLEKAADAKKTK